MDGFAPLNDLILRCLQSCCRIVDEASVSLVHLIASCTRNSFDSSDACCDTGFGYDPELADLCAVCKVCTSAELEIERITEITYCNDSYDLAVLLAEARSSAELLSFFDAQYLSLNRKSLKDNVIDHLFYLSDLLSCHCLEVVEVES